MMINRYQALDLVANALYTGVPMQPWLCDQLRDLIGETTAEEKERLRSTRLAGEAAAAAIDYWRSAYKNILSERDRLLALGECLGDDYRMAIKCTPLAPSPQLADWDALMDADYRR